MAGLGGRKSRSLPRGPVGRPREAFAAGEGHLALGAMVAGAPNAQMLKSPLASPLNQTSQNVVEMCTENRDRLVVLNAFLRLREW
jgi:hypothetical protein